MSEFLSETEGCDLLARLFRSRGYAIQRNLLFREYGVVFHIDGWDAKARVGFEFLSSEDDDHDDLSLAEYQTLSDAQQRGELSLFIIDEVEPLSAADLTESANEFLDEVEAAVESRRRGPVGRRGGSGRPPARVAARAATAGKKSVKKPVKAPAKQAAAGKTAAKNKTGASKTGASKTGKPVTQRAKQATPTAARRGSAKKKRPGAR